MRSVIIPHLEGGSIGPSTESCINCDVPISMVPCWHQKNIYTKRKLRVWINQKWIPLVGAITPLTCAGRQNTPSRGRYYRAQNGKLGKLGRTYGSGTVFAPRKYFHQKEATGMGDQKCIPLVGVITPFTCAGRQNTPSRGRQYRAQNRKLGKLGRTYCHGTEFAPRKYLHQKEATGLDRPDVYAASRCNNST